MLLQDKHAVVFGAGGKMGGAAARAFAREGATVHLAGRTAARLDAVAADVAAHGGTATVTRLDTLDRAAVDAFVERIAQEAGRIDASFDGVGFDAVQDVPLTELAPEDFLAPIEAAMRSRFNTATAVARQMVAQRSGTIVLLSATAAREWRWRMGGFSIACGAIETLTRTLAGEVGEHGVRVVCVRANFTPETAYEPIPDEAIAALSADAALGRLPRLAEVGDAAAFLASDRAGATTGQVVDLSCGAIMA